ncbi:PriCT-2 domain-containing protein [Bradyrhizobium elkanii]
MNHTLALMKSAARWLFSKQIGTKKIPYYVNGSRRAEGKSLDTPEDWAQLVTYDELCARFDPKKYTGGGFALGPDGTGDCWQGVDFDKVVQNGLADLANEWVHGDHAQWCYVELSPSKLGMHVISYGKPFPYNLNSNNSGIEAYASARFFTFTGDEILPRHPQPSTKRGQPGDLYDYVGSVLLPRHSINGKTGRPKFAGPALEPLSVRQVTELIHAVQWINPEPYYYWFHVGMALKRYGNAGWQIWNSWSQLCPQKYNASDAIKKWEGFNPHTLDFRYVIAIAMRHGWINPAGKEAQDYLMELERLQVVPPPYAQSAFSRQVGGIDIIPNGGIGLITNGQLYNGSVGNNGNERRIEIGSNTRATGCACQT